MKILGLIGNPISQSRSPEVFQRFFDAEGLTDFRYELFPLRDISALPILIQNQPELVGLNVTIPFKKSVIPFLDNLDESAARLGAVNTIKIDRRGNKTLLTGFNTDIFGFEKSLLEAFPNLPKSALILGSGGASNAVASVLDGLRISWKKISRSDESGANYESLDSKTVGLHKLIVNTTPLGMGNFENEKPNIPYSAIGSEHCCFDLVYHSEFTPFLTACAARGASIKNGNDMLLYQAQKSWEILKG